MNILVVNFHPVDSHFYKNIGLTLKKHGSDVLFLVLEKENIVEKIAKSYGFNTIKIGEIGANSFKKIIRLPGILFKFILNVLKFKPDIIVSATSPYSGITSKLFGIDSIGFTDTETATFNNKIAFSLFRSILTPSCFGGDVPSKKHISFNGYKELAYLHPNWFVPDDEVLKKLNLNKSDKFVLMRFSALHAMHDIGLKSVGDNYKEQILKYIQEIEKYAKVYISTTEHNPGGEFKKYELKIHPSEYIHFLSFCSLYIGEGTTTASEAGVLGVPWINIQKTTRGYLIDHEKNYKLGFRTDNVDKAFKTAIEWIQKDDLKIGWQVKRDKLLNDKIDVSSFLIWFIENYPESHKIMKENPEYQNRFK